MLAEPSLNWTFPQASPKPSLLVRVAAWTKRFQPEVEAGCGCRIRLVLTHNGECFSKDERQAKNMDEPALRVVRPGLAQPKPRAKLAILLVSVMLLSLMQPVSGNVAVARDDFGVLEAFAATLADRAAESESLVAIQGAESSFALVDASKREVRAGDALADSESTLEQVELRDTSPLELDHPRPYEFLIDVSTHPDAWPYNLWETLFSVESLGLDNLLGIGINTYAIYVNFSSRNNGPCLLYTSPSPRD